MSVAGGILARLKATSAVTDIVGTGSNARIYAMHLPQNPSWKPWCFRK